MKKSILQYLFLMFLLTTSFSCIENYGKEQSIPAKIEVKKWHDEEQTIPESAAISHGGESAIYIRYFRDGSIEHLVPYYKGQKHGLAQIFYSDGSLSLEFNYVRNTKHGAYRSFTKNGDLSIKGQYCEGEMCGDWKYYDDSSELEKIEKYENDSLVKTINMN